ncbi:MAG: hypothetical protein B6D35_11860 [Candidatus Brocadia sp. UTAMX2]|jgi:hypothetical protein|nr:MAG: hypothetical protein B6D35_11860 [Candidatus Brocadia sp. UTAMX2]
MSSLRDFSKNQRVTGMKPRRKEERYRSYPMHRWCHLEFGCQFHVEFRDGSLAVILKAFCKVLPELLRDFVQEALAPRQ